MKHAFLRQAVRLHGFTLSMALVAVAVTGLMGVRDAKAQTKFTAGTVFLSATAWPHYGDKTTFAMLEILRGK